MFQVPHAGFAWFKSHMVLLVDSGKLRVNEFSRLGINYLSRVEGVFARSIQTHT